MSTLTPVIEILPGDFIAMHGRVADTSYDDQTSQVEIRMTSGQTLSFDVSDEAYVEDES